MRSFDAEVVLLRLAREPDSRSNPKVLPSASKSTHLKLPDLKYYYRCVNGRERERERERTREREAREKRANALRRRQSEPVNHNMSTTATSKQLNLIPAI